MDATLRSEPQRKQWVDALRALAMLLVMYGHFADGSTAFFVYTSPIKIPLFFAVSGYVFSARGGDVKAFLMKLLRGLVIPWLVLCLGQVVFVIPARGVSGAVEYVQEVLIGKNFWYMPCCILGQIIFFFVLKYVKKQWICTVVLLGLTGLGLVLSKIPAFDLLKFDTALVAQSYLLIGYVFKKYEDKFDRLHVLWLLLGLVSYVLLGIGSLIIFPGMCLDVHTDSYYNILWCAAMIALGCFLGFACFKRIRWFPQLVVALGRNTLVFYIFHSRSMLVLDILGIDIDGKWWTGLAKLAIASALCGITAFVINRILPEIVGKPRKKVAKAA